MEQQQKTPPSKIVKQQVKQLQKQLDYLNRNYYKLPRQYSHRLSMAKSENQKAKIKAWYRIAIDKQVDQLLSVKKNLKNKKVEDQKTRKEEGKEQTPNFQKKFMSIFSLSFLRKKPVDKLSEDHQQSKGKNMKIKIIEQQKQRLIEPDV